MIHNEKSPLLQSVTVVLSYPRADGYDANFSAWRCLLLLWRLKAKRWGHETTSSEAPLGAAGVCLSALAVLLSPVVPYKSTVLRWVGVGPVHLYFKPLI